MVTRRAQRARRRKLAGALAGKGTRPGIMVNQQPRLGDLPQPGIVANQLPKQGDLPQPGIVANQLPRFGDLPQPGILANPQGLGDRLDVPQPGILANPLQDRRIRLTRPGVGSSFVGPSPRIPAGVSSLGAITGRPGGRSILTLGGLGSALGGLGSAVGAFGAGGVGSGVTEEARDAAVGAIRQGFGRGEDVLGTPFSAGGATVTGSTVQTPREARREGLPQAALAFLAQQGITGPEAQEILAGINQRGRGGGRTRAFTRGLGRDFIDFVQQQGDQFGLRVNRRGKIRGTERVIPGGIETETDPLNEAAAAINQGLLEGFGEASGQVGRDVQEGLGFRSDIRDLLRQELLGAGPEGLTEEDLAGLAREEEAGMSRVQDRLREDLQRVTGQLAGSGFSSSNLARRSLEESAFNPLASNLRDLEAQQSQRRQQILNARAARRNARIASILGAAGGLGSADLGAIRTSFINPAEFGGFTTPQAVAAAQRQQQFDVGLQTGRGTALGSALLTPTLQDTGGLF